VKNGTRFAALGGVVVAGALALSACGSDNNTSGSTSSAPAASSSDCAKGTVNAAGSSAQKNAIEEWSKGYSAGCAGATLNYNPSGPGAGVQAFTAGQVAFAGSDSALKPEEHAPADARCKTGKAIDLPMVVGPIAVAYNLKGVTGLQLSPATTAGIFAGTIKTWNDPAIKKDNPSATLPSTPIKTLHRSDDSGTTDNFTKYLTATAPDIWKFAGGKKWTAPGGQGLKGSDGVSTALKQTDGSVGYVEMSFATNNSLSTAKVKNGAGEYVDLTPENAGKSVASAAPVGTGNDLALKIDYKTTAAGAYPIVLVTYEIVCEKGLPTEQANFVKAFLTYTSGSAGQSALTKLGYAPLPDSVLTKVQTAVKALS
jgi:phosphate transport system substrate-binding protein